MGQILNLEQIIQEIFKETNSFRSWRFLDNWIISLVETQKNSELQVGLEPTTFHVLGGRSNQWAIGDLTLSKDTMWVWPPRSQMHEHSESP